MGLRARFTGAERELIRVRSRVDSMPKLAYYRVEI